MHATPLLYSAHVPVVGTASLRGSDSDSDHDHEKQRSPSRRKAGTTKKMVAAALKRECQWRAWLRSCVRATAFTLLFGFVCLVATSSAASLYSASLTVQTMETASDTMHKAKVLFGVLYRFGCNATDNPLHVQILSAEDCATLQPSSATLHAFLPPQPPPPTTAPRPLHPPPKLRPRAAQILR